MNLHLRAGIVCGCFFATLHLCWALLVWFGWAQPIINFVFWLHMLSVPVQIQPFDLMLAALLVVFTWCVGFVLGWLLSTIWLAGARRDTWR